MKVCRNVPAGVALAAGHRDGGILRAVVVARIQKSVEQRHSGEADGEPLRRLHFRLSLLLDAAFDYRQAFFDGRGGAFGLARARAEFGSKRTNLFAQLLVGAFQSLHPVENLAQFGGRRGFGAERRQQRQGRGQEPLPSETGWITAAPARGAVFTISAGSIRIEELLQFLSQPRGRERLGEVGVRARRAGTVRGPRIGVAAHDDDGQAGVALAAPDTLDQFESVHARHVQVGDDSAHYRGRFASRCAAPPRPNRPESRSDPRTLDSATSSVVAQVSESSTTRTAPELSSMLIPRPSRPAIPGELPASYGTNR